MRRVFYSFHYQNDAWRVSQIKNMGIFENERDVQPNEWEEIKRGGDLEIKRWIDENLKSRSCLVVLIGSETANRKYVQYEIQKAWEMGKGVCGIYIHHLKDQYGQTSRKGEKPFEQFYFKENCLRKFSPTVFEPKLFSSKSIYDQIKDELPDLIEKAIYYRNLFNNGQRLTLSMK